MNDENNTEETVTISKAEYESLKKDQRWLTCLENAGVDNWDGYEYAREILENWEKTKKRKE